MGKYVLMLAAMVSLAVPAAAELTVAPPETSGAGNGGQRVVLYAPPEQRAAEVAPDKACPPEKPCPSDKPRIQAHKPAKKKAHSRKADKAVITDKTVIDENGLQPADALQNRVQALKDQLTLEQHIHRSTQNAADAVNMQATVLFNYVKGSIYSIDTAPDHFTDVAMQDGEEIRDFASGDTARWVFARSTSGDGDRAQSHLMVKPVQAGLATNFTIYTNRHVYFVKARSTMSFYMPAVAWLYPAEEREALIAIKQENRKVDDMRANGPAPITPEKLNFNYSIKGDKYDWRPVRVLDDGQKTYIAMPPTMGSSEAPALFIVDESGELNLVNYRVSGNYYVVDRLFKEARLQLSEKEFIRIKRDY